MRRKEANMKEREREREREVRQELRGLERLAFVPAFVCVDISAPSFPFFASRWLPATFPRFVGAVQIPSTLPLMLLLLARCKVRS